MNRLNEVLDIFFDLRDILEERPLNEIIEHIILDPFISKEPPLEDKNNQNYYPKIEGVYNYFV